MDTEGEGFVLKAKVHSALKVLDQVGDQVGIKALVRKAEERFPRLSHLLWVDAG